MFAAYMVFDAWDFTMDIILTAVSSGPLLPAAKKDDMLPIPVVNYGELSFDRFSKEFRGADRPFVMRNIPPTQAPCFGALGAFNSSMLNGCTGNVQLLKKTSGTANRKGLKQIGNLNYTEFVRLLEEEGGFERAYGKGHYFGHGQRIDYSCPDLWKHVRIPSYFTGQLLLRRVHQPGGIDMYFNTKGLTQTYHIDVPKAELWASVCSGRKRYRVVPRSVASQKIGWGGKLHKLLLLRPEEWPLGLPVYHGEIGPGELVYLPAGSLHAVENLEDTLNIVNDVIDAGSLIPISAVNERIMRAGCASWVVGPCRKGQFGNFLDRMHRGTQVFDGQGAVSDAAKVPEGFPTWGDLVSWIV